MIEIILEYFTISLYISLPAYVVALIRHRKRKVKHKPELITIPYQPKYDEFGNMIAEYRNRETDQQRVTRRPRKVE